MATFIGMDHIFSHWPSGYMWTGTGPRNVVKTIALPANVFSAPPKVVASISTLDSARDFNTRVKVTVQNIQTTQFDVKVETWADTKLAMVDVAWVANKQ